MPVGFFWRFVCLLPWLLAAGAAPAGSIYAGSPAQAQVERLVKPLVDGQCVVGVAVGVVDADGTQVFGLGRTKLDGPAPDGNTVFEIGSITKAFTGILLADRVERGLVAYDDPVAKLLPDGESPAMRVKVPTRNGKAITLAHLATHISGLPRMPSNFRPTDARNPYIDYTVPLMYEFLTSHKLRRDPGAQYEYSNYGAGLLGHVLARKAGVGYEPLVIDRICRPLGMADTCITLSPRLKARLATGHNVDGDAVANWDIPALAGCGALRSTAKDMLKFLAANMRLAASPLAGAMTASHSPRAKAGSDVSIGLGWHVWHSDGIVWHNGGTGGYASFAGFVKAKRVGVVLLANTAAYGQVTAAGRLLLRALTGQKAEPLKLRPVVRLTPEQLDACVGRYAINDTLTLAVTRHDSRLRAQITGQPTVGIYPESPTRFFYKVAPAQITFTQGKQGRMASLIIHQGGADTPAKRIAKEGPPR
ncbi:MAG: serine hydrolase [Candidatus Brocadiae bacterium]|nr:serine hydrolase [Candidatus Brocadiia bacterium]